MKNLLFTAFFLVINLCVINSYAQWESLDSPTNISLNEACFLNVNLGYLVGGISGVNGVILKTTNGESFIEISIPFTNQLNGVHFISNDIGYVAGHGGLIAKTEDGGFNWIVQASNTLVQLNSIYFLNENIGFATGAGGEIHGTIDGGQNWTSIFYNGGYQMNHLTFIDQNIGYAAADYGQIAKTVDGGVTWEMFNTSASGNLFCIEFFNENIGYCCSTIGEILKTQDGGASWAIKNGITNYALRYIHCFSEDEVYICGNNGTILYTEDGGVVWEFEGSNTSNSLQSIVFPSSEIGYACGFDGEIVKSVKTDFDEIKFVYENNINIYPNPFQSCITIESENFTNEEIVIRIVDNKGRLYKNLNLVISNDGINEKINLTNLNPGIYFINIYSKEFRQIKKIVKK